MKKIFLFLVLFTFVHPLELNAQSGRIKRKKKAKKEIKVATPKKKVKAKAYTDFVTPKTKTDEGLFNVHKNDNKFLYEIPKSYLGKEMILVTRIKDIPADLGGGYVNAGSKINTQVIVWEAFQNKILLKVKSYNAIANDSLPIYKSVKANNLEPVIYAFDIKSQNQDSTAVLVDVTNFFATDVKAITGLPERYRKTYKVKRLDASRSFINSIKSYPKNIEVIQDFTFDAAAPPSNRNTNTITIRINQSMILLPEKPMMPRLYDKRVGYFSIGNVDYNSEALKADSKRYIRRWRLEPTDEGAYERGELVTPKKPIVYYIDPATPEKLRKYIKKGVDDWQKVFETAGFKNAIYAKMPPTKEEDPEFSMEDIRYSSIRYVASTTRNATGPSVSDPRTGEIIESDIIWYHNHLRSYRNRYLLETGAANPSARTLNTKPEEIGEMMRMVIAHEVGHALGLPHNMAASFAYPVDSLRSGKFTQKYGIAATIMDYARYNYIAQPGDENIRFIRQLGPYDHYAINWGYRKIPTAKKPEDEVNTLDKWISDKANDPKYRFGGQRFDPSSQTEGIGNDQVKASTYGIKNLKIVATNLPKWTSDQTNNYEDLSELYGELLSVWNRYVGHVAGNIGGVYEFNKKPEQNGNVYKAVAKDRQIASLNWLLKNTFATQRWLLDKNILNKIDETGYSGRILRYQNRHLNSLLNVKTLKRMIDAEVIETEFYAVSDMLRTLRKGVFSETKKTQNVDLFRRNLQKSFIDRMGILMNDSNTKNTDISSIVRGELVTLKYIISIASKRAISTMTKYHYRDCIHKIETLLNPIK
ncbi:MAG: zinc-dependent metalloprotease [Polaribacter sp.]|nr:zinc-dependent metalloprotease [Polaribacter sp.]MBT5098975.1 zinc-dependent metalloprotease [Polaribacter sp.]MBT5645716.1 zinc-dependent metalloprotease [Polaribacter sp.]MDG1111097.1 zinc-dependent metalloprotease [Polaribacter sp.]MDG1222001.1 zinc-dependent metalloprotease [Polaribacter sp.]